MKEKCKRCEQFEDELGAYVLPTLVYIRIRGVSEETDDLLAAVQKRLLPFRSKSHKEPKRLPLGEDRPRG